MPDEDKTFSGSFVLDLRIWWRQAHTLYCCLFEKFFKVKKNGVCLVASCCLTLPYVGSCCLKLPYVALCCPMFSYVALYCIMLPYIVVCCLMGPRGILSWLICSYVASSCQYSKQHKLSTVHGIVLKSGDLGSYLKHATSIFDIPLAEA